MRPPGGPKRPQEAPRKPQEALMRPARGPQEAPERPQETTQELDKGAGSQVQPPAPETFTTGNTTAYLALISILNFSAGSYL